MNRIIRRRMLVAAITIAIGSAAVGFAPSSGAGIAATTSPTTAKAPTPTPLHWFALTGGHWNEPK